jgi:hypothetical protein
MLLMFRQTRSTTPIPQRNFSILTEKGSCQHRQHPISRLLRDNGVMFRDHAVGHFWGKRLRAVFIRSVDSGVEEVAHSRHNGTGERQFRKSAGAIGWEGARLNQLCQTLVVHSKNQARRMKGGRDLAERGLGRLTLEYLT